MKPAKSLYAAVLCAAMTLPLTACSSSAPEEETSEAIEVSEITPAKETADPTENWETITCAGISMKLPEDMTEFMSVSDMNIYCNEENTSVVIVSYKSENDGTRSGDITQEMIETSVLDEYENIKFLEFDNEYDFYGTGAVHFIATVDNEDGSLLFNMFMLLFDDNQTQIVEYLTDLSGDLTEDVKIAKAWQKTVTFAKEDDKSEGGLKTDSTDTSASAGNTTSLNPVASSEYVVQNDYFYVRVPEEWADTVIYRTWTNDEGTELMMALHEPTSYEALENGGTLVTFMLLPEKQDYTYYPSYDYLGTMKIDGTVYNVVALYPTDAGYTQKTQAAYKKWMEQRDNVVATFAAQEGYTFTPAK